MTTSRKAPGYVQSVGAHSAVAVTPNDSTELPEGMTGLYVGGAGNVAVTMADGTEATFTGMTAGVIHPIAVRKIKTGTTATGIVALY